MGSVSMVLLILNDRYGRVLLAIYILLITIVCIKVVTNESVDDISIK
jgi:hypothetical protein